MLLKQFSDCVATTLTEAEERVHSNAKGSLFELLGKEKTFLFEVNVARLGDLSLISASCDVPCRLIWAPADFVRQMFQISGRSTLSFQKHIKENDAEHAGCIVPAHTVLRIESVAAYESFTVRIDPDALRRKLAALIGEDVDMPEFDHSAHVHDIGMRSLRLAFLELAREMDQIGSNLSAPVLAELAQSAIVKFLLYQKHKYSDRLMRASASPSQRQLDLLEEYIAAHWNQTLDIEKLVKVSNIGARTIFRLFAKKRGISPSMLVRSMRLAQARTRLLGANRDASVLAIATQCGFHSFGHFAREYRQAFGELPLETLRPRTRSVFKGRVQRANVTTS